MLCAGGNAVGAFRYCWRRGYGEGVAVLWQRRNGMGSENIGGMDCGGITRNDVARPVGTARQTHDDRPAGRAGASLRGGTGAGQRDGWGQRGAAGEAGDFAMDSGGLYIDFDVVPA